MRNFLFSKESGFNTGAYLEITSVFYQKNKSKLSNKSKNVQHRLQYAKDFVNCQCSMKDTFLEDGLIQMFTYRQGVKNSVTRQVMTFSDSGNFSAITSLNVTSLSFLLSPQGILIMYILDLLILLSKSCFFSFIFYSCLWIYFLGSDFQFTDSFFSCV